MPSIYHPVGAHAHETLSEIVARKQNDIQEYGFTLWSFAPMRIDRVKAWQRELTDQSSTLVYCGGKQTKDPAKPNVEVRWLTKYTTDLDNWQCVPHNQMVSYHRPPNANGVAASAFIVDGIILPNGLKVRRPDNWYSMKDNAWVNRQLPTRGEYLIYGISQSDAKTATPISLILRLKYPFFAWVA